MRVDFFRHNIGQAEIDAAVDVLKSIFITTGRVVEDFEHQFSSYLGGGHSVGVNSCTAALHLALVALNIGPEHEVITTPLTFVSSVSPILYVGAKPVFVDVEPTTGNLDVSKVEAAITKRTAAIMPVHLHGHMADVVALRQIADRHGLPIVEDSAHCIEGVRDDIRPGGLSDAACFSFYATKNITSAEGGVLFTKNEELAANVRRLRLHGMSASANDRYTKGYRHYDVDMLGYKYNMANVNAALLLGQLQRIESLLERREALAQRYNRGFRDNPRITVQEVLPHTRSARHLYAIRVDPRNRDRTLVELQQRGIGVSVHFNPVHLMTYYRRSHGYSEGDFPVAESIGQSTVSLPLYPSLTDDETDYVIQAVNEVV